MSEPIRVEIPETEFPETETQTAPEPACPMHWHGFLTKCMLWLAFLVHILQAVWIFTGRIYYTPEVRAQIYAGIPEMRIIDWALAGCLLISAGLQFAARGKLARLQWRGVQLILAAYASLAASQLIYALARFLFAGLSPLNIPVIAQVLAYTALLLVNKTYYARRRSAFGKELK